MKTFPSFSLMRAPGLACLCASNMKTYRVTAAVILTALLIFIASYVGYQDSAYLKALQAREGVGAGRWKQLRRGHQPTPRHNPFCGGPEKIDGKIEFSVLYTNVRPDPDKHNIFLMETSSSAEIHHRSFCVIESYCSTNPSSVVWLLLTTQSLTPHSLEDLEALMAVHHNLCVAHLDFPILLQDTPLLALYLSTNFWNSKYLPNNLSDIGRLAVVYKSGGFYSDMDVVALRDVSHLRNFVGQQNSGQPAVLNNAVFHFDKSHPIPHRLMEYIAKNYQGNVWGANGPNTLTKVVADVGCVSDSLLIKLGNDSAASQYCEIETSDEDGGAHQSPDAKSEELAGSDQRAASNLTFTCPLVVLHQSAFYPVGWRQAETLFVRSTEHESDVSVHTMFPRSCGVHLWNKLTKELKIQNGSTALKLARNFCPIAISNYLPL